MTSIDDLLEQLGSGDVPPLPGQFERGVHRRVNRVLTFSYVADFVLRGIPYAILHLVAPIGGLVWLTISGRFPNHGSDTKRS